MAPSREDWQKLHNLIREAIVIGGWEPADWQGALRTPQGTVTASWNGRWPSAATKIRLTMAVDGAYLLNKRSNVFALANPNAHCIVTAIKERLLPAHKTVEDQVLAARESRDARDVEQARQVAGAKGAIETLFGKPFNFRYVSGNYNSCNVELTTDDNGRLFQVKAGRLTPEQAKKVYDAVEAVLALPDNDDSTIP